MYRSLFSGVDVTLQLFDKMATRLPEALMFAFHPITSDDSKFTLDKLGYTVDPSDVVTNGSQRQHGKTGLSQHFLL